MRRLHKIRANFDKSGECNALKWLSSIRECGRLRIALAENLFSVPRFAIPYESGPGRSVFVKNALLEAVALDKTFYLSQSDVSDKYVSASYDRDFGSILRSVAGAGSLFEPPPLAMHETKSLDACVDTFVSIFSNRCASPSEGTFCEDKLHASQDDAPLSC